MLVNDRLIVLRLRKCATTHVVETIRRTVGGEFRKSLELRGTTPTSHGRLDIPTEGRRVLGTIRDPWSWYVSLFAYGCEGRGGLYRTVTRDVSARSALGSMWRETRAKKALPRASFGRYRQSKRHPAALWQELYADVNDTAAFRAWLALVLDPGQSHVVDRSYATSGLADLVGFLSWRYLAIFSRDADPLLAPGGFASVEDLVNFDTSDNVCDELIRTDRIATDLPAVLDRAGFVLDPAQQAKLDENVHAREPRNASAHRSPLDYYDAAAADLVTERDRLVIERHGYEPPVTR